MQIKQNSFFVNRYSNNNSLENGAEETKLDETKKDCNLSSLETLDGEKSQTKRNRFPILHVSDEEFSKTVELGETVDLEKYIAKMNNDTDTWYYETDSQLFEGPVSSYLLSSLFRDRVIAVNTLVRRSLNEDSFSFSAFLKNHFKTMKAKAIKQCGPKPSRKGKRFRSAPERLNNQIRCHKKERASTDSRKSFKLHFLDQVDDSSSDEEEDFWGTRQRSETLLH